MNSAPNAPGLHQSWIELPYPALAGWSFPLAEVIGAEPGPHIRIQRQGVVEELPHTGLNTERLLRGHRLDAGAQRRKVDGVRKRLRLNG